MLALKIFSQSHVSPKEETEKEKPISKEISKPSSQTIVVSGEISSSQIVLSQPTPSKKTSDWFDKTHFQNILSMEAGFYHTDHFQAIWDRRMDVLSLELKIKNSDINNLCKRNDFVKILELSWYVALLDSVNAETSLHLEPDLT